MELAPQLPVALMPFSQCTMVPLHVPLQCDATCFVHWYGVSIALAAGPYNEMINFNGASAVEACPRKSEEYHWSASPPMNP